MRYFVDLHSYEFDEDNRTGWVHALPIGEYRHPLYGKMKITQERVKRFADNIRNNVRGIDLDINYDHKRLSGEASGWVKDAKVEANGLWLLVDWTENAAKQLKSKAYRYFSAEFVDEWKDPATGTKYEDVLFGGALTNRPFMKDLVPINLSEIEQGDNTMDEETRKKLAGILGLKEDATEAEVNSALKDYTPPSPADLSKAKVTKQDDGTYKVTADGAQGEAVIKPEPVKASEDDDDIKKLAEDNPAVAKLLSDREADRKRLDDLENARKLSEADRKIDAMGEGVPKVVRDMLRPLLVKAPMQLSEEIHDVVKKFAEVGPVPQGQQHGKVTSPNQQTGDVVEEMLTKLDEVMAEDKNLTYNEALIKLEETHPELMDRYNKETKYESEEV